MHTEVDLMELANRIAKEQTVISKFFDEFAKKIIGQRTMVERLFMGLLTGGHVLLEGVPGLAKTLAMRTLAGLLALDYKRIQFTPDLLPSDLVGTLVYNPKSGAFDTKKGPVFTHIVLADEINRAPAKVQSALLEAMQEHQVTIGETSFPLPEPFLVVATQNPIEQEGTYPLPEAQVDRFMMKVVLDYPNKDQEKEIVRRYGSGGTESVQPVLSLRQLEKLRQLTEDIYLDDKILEYIVGIVFATRNPGEYGLDSNLFALGASPRASLCLAALARAEALLEGRAFVLPDDVRMIAPDVLRHRIMPSYEAESEGIETSDLVQRVLDHVPVP
ncbi:MAG: MoxR family ATPase [Spirochaetota bacterium]|jgi:MoxR-like ATPase|nr:MoxR family ATPase [Spirochaetota bacterium]